jgi:penicillin-binding protein 1C
MKAIFLTRSKFCRRAGITVVVCGTVALAGWIALRFVPLPPALVNGQSPELEFVDRNGEPLRSVRAAELPFERTVSYGEIPRPLIEATLAAEDERFWTHHGVDFRASLRALWQLVYHRHIVSGGSTITQQLIKIAEPRPRTLRTKVMEALQAARLEQVWDKQRILTEYLNRLDYGNFNCGAATAAQYYFAKPLRDLTPAECALLASLPQAPSRLNPNSHLARSRKRQEWILTRMRAAGWLTAEEFDLARNEPLHFAKPQRPFEAPHFVDLILANCQNDLSAFSGPIKTTVDLELNRFAEGVLREHLANVQAQRVSNGALVVLDNRTGDVLALVGSEDYFSPSAGQVNGAWAARSPGSALKPFTYLLALERGATPATVVADVPSEFVTSTGLFAPVNYNRRCYGPMRYRLALANSLNISAVKVLESVGGPEPLQQLLQHCGLSTLNRPPNDYGLGLTIGNADVRLLELANAYACLARLGEYEPYRLLVGGARFARSESGSRFADPRAAYLIADMLSDNDARTLAFGAESELRFNFPVACKTGTSSDFRDNCAFGYTPEFTVGVWVGNADGSPMQHVSGVTGAGPILHDLFEHLHERYGTTWYSRPPNVVECSINPITGKRLAQPGPDAIKEKFLADNLPPMESADDYEMLSPSKRVVRLGSEYRDWFSSGDNWLGNRAVIRANSNAVCILFPPAGTIVYLDADLSGQGCRLSLRASGPEQIEWRSDSLKLERIGNREVALLTEGRHQLTVRDAISGAEAETWLEVRSR